MSSDKPDDKAPESADEDPSASAPSNTKESHKLSAKNAENIVEAQDAKDLKAAARVTAAATLNSEVSGASSMREAPAKVRDSNEKDEDEEGDEEEEEDGEGGGQGEHDHELPPASAATIARRNMLGKISIALGCAGGLALAGPAVGFIVAPLFRDQQREWRPIGPLEKFVVGETVNVVFVDASPLPWAGVTSKTAAWLRRVSETEFEAFSVNCAHLGCPVRWMPDAKLFMCPCHGGVYYQDGSVAAGPPPHALPQYPVRIRDGQVEIRTDPIPIG